MGVAVTIDSVVEPLPDVMVGPAGDELVLLDAEREIYFGLNVTGRRMWEAVTAGEPLESAVGDLVVALDVDEETVRADLVALMNELLANGLVRVMA